jgi:hypothetical protein
MSKKFHFTEFYNKYSCNGNLVTSKLYKVNCSYCLNRINETSELKQKLKLSRKHFLNSVKEKIPYE